MIPYSELRQQPRRPASELLHLPAPLGIFIEPTNVCNFRCTMCPQSLPEFADESGYFRRMSGETFDSIVEQLRPWGKIPVIRLYGTGEPMLHPEIFPMIRDLRPFAERLELTTNGTLLTLLKARRAGLIVSGLDYLRVSIYGLSPEECRMAGAKWFDLRAALAEFRNLRGGFKRPWVHVQFTGQCSDPEKFRQMFEPVADSIGMETLHNWGDLVKLGEAPTRKVCPKPFYELFIHANGDVSACCLDWSGKLNLGNVHRETLQEIWHGEKLAKLRALHLEGRRSEIPICASCSMPDTLPDNLDSV